MTTTQFAAYDDQAIWGVGRTELDAMNDALEGFPNATFAADNGASLLTAPMTEALKQKVEEKGGAVAFMVLADGRIGTHAEWEAAMTANSQFSISVDVIYGRADEEDRDRAARAACEVLDAHMVQAADACAEYRRQWEEMDTEDGMTGLALVWIDATKAADIALTEGWADTNGAACSISA